MREGTRVIGEGTRGEIASMYTYERSRALSPRVARHIWRAGSGESTDSGAERTNFARLVTALDGWQLRRADPGCNLLCCRKQGPERVESS